MSKRTDMSNIKTNITYICPSFSMTCRLGNKIDKLLRELEEEERRSKRITLAVTLLALLFLALTMGCLTYRALMQGSYIKAILVMSFLLPVTLAGHVVCTVTLEDVVKRRALLHIIPIAVVAVGFLLGFNVVALAS